jgi:diacylglycerol kinase (ATP)
MRPRLPLIISTAAGAARPDLVEPVLRGALAAEFALDITYAGSLDVLRAAIADELARGVSTLGIGGGDGTLHHAVNAIGDARVTLAPLPLGTGNDFCRSLGFNTLEASLLALASGRHRAVDLLEVNGRRVLTVAGLGVVARSALLVTRLTRPGAPLRTPLRWCGPHAYLVAGGLHLLAQPRLAARVRVVLRDPTGVATRTIEGSFYGAFLAVRPTLGAGMRLPIEVAPDDGRFELALVENAPRLRVAMNLPRLRRGRRLSDGVLTIYPATTAEIEWAGGTPVLGDGEPLGPASSVRAVVLPNALQVVAGPADGVRR